MGWVVRAGEATPRDLQAKYQQHIQVPSVWGFSVQYDAAASVDELARAGAFPNGQISYQEEQVLAAALLAFGYRMRLVPTPGRGYHHTFMVLYDASGVMLQTLPLDAATTLHQTFLHIPNPHRVPYGHRGGQP
jgi:hypothetical protein